VSVRRLESSHRLPIPGFPAQQWSHEVRGRGDGCGSGRGRRCWNGRLRGRIDAAQRPGYSRADLRSGGGVYATRHPLPNGNPRAEGACHGRHTRCTAPCCGCHWRVWHGFGFRVRFWFWFWIRVRVGVRVGFWIGLRQRGRRRFEFGRWFRFERRRRHKRRLSALSFHARSMLVPCSFLAREAPLHAASQRTAHRAAG
jgi:hypothetical protein